ncbi:regulator of G-protein signaling protein-like [Saccopteryx bilineata]|uniref:regulator of G-protein signaling protein-like n=1 Tax=Saccopteryx bilineata TaxID=59482 RepID=UPI00338E9668
MNNAEIIGSTNLLILLEDEIFADFFNTFLSLPIFGQTPFYTVENAQWSLWPEIPHDLVPKYKGLLTWLGKYRLPFFCKTNLCFHYILCQELISFINSPEGGEELVDFWILAERILSIDEMDLEQRDHYLSLLLMLKASYLQEGSRVVTLCNMNLKSILNLSIWHLNQSTTRKDILNHMKKVALFKLQSYWLPKFYTHAKTILAKEESCQGLMQEYDTRLCSVCCTHLGGFPLNMSIRKSHHPQRRYSSRKTKLKMWQSLDHVSWSSELDIKPDTNTLPSQEVGPQEKVVTQKPSLKKASPREKIASSLKKDILYARRKSNMKKKAKSHLHMEGVFETEFSSHLRTATPITSHSIQKTIKKAAKQRLCLGYTHWAFCADVCAGRPFRDHLKKLNLKVEVQLLDLWQDLYHFLGILMNNRQTGNAIFWKMLGNQICELYLNEQIGPCLPLKPQTIEGLKELLPTGDMNPWIPRAQSEICQMLAPWYDEFLDEEDYWFLTFATQTKYISTRWHGGDSISKEENLLFYKRFQESLDLSQGLANMEEMESMQWQKIATEDLRQGGSIQVEVKSPMFLEDTEKMSFEELCYKYPKLAIEKISNDYKIYCEKAPKTDSPVEIFREPRTRSFSQKKLSFSKKISFVRKPSLKPRNLTEILLNAHHLEFFMEFLKEQKAEGPLQFLIAVQKVSAEMNEKIRKSLIENIVKTFFHGKISPEEMLQCDAPIIKEISQMHHVSIAALLELQSFVMKSLEKKWFEDYQELFPASPQETHTRTQTVPRKTSKGTTTHLHGSQKRAWLKMVSFIRSFCKYRRFMSNVSTQKEFEDYLHKEIHNNKENIATPSNISGHLSPYHTNVRSADENGDIILAKRRIFGHKMITVNFAINDLHFFSEMEKFNNLVSSARVLQVNRAYNENDVILMKSKIDIILKLYLQSDIPPKLRVNISESQKDAILAAISDGHLDRGIFHMAIMSVFPVIMYFWKRFCSWKATRSYLEFRGKKFSDGRIRPKSMHKDCPPSGGDHTILRFSLLKGFEWLRPQLREAVIASSVQNCKLDNLTQSRQTLSSMLLYSVPG